MISRSTSNEQTAILLDRIVCRLGVLWRIRFLPGKVLPTV